MHAGTCACSVPYRSERSATRVPFALLRATGVYAHAGSSTLLLHSLQVCMHHHNMFNHTAIRKSRLYPRAGTAPTQCSKKGCALAPRLILPYPAPAPRRITTAYPTSPILPVSCPYPCPPLPLPCVLPRCTTFRCHVDPRGHQAKHTVPYSSRSCTATAQTTKTVTKPGSTPT